MTLQWNEFLETGVPEIDGQHKELFMRVNAYVQALMNTAEEKEIDRLFEYLNEYVSMHFSTEENLLKAINYPDLVKHQAQHSYFKKRFTELKRRYDGSGISEELINQVHKEVANWLISHVQKTDHEWSNYLKKKNEGAL